MKNYILTEKQINKLVNQPMIKKGVALKISDDKGEYYKSILKEFTDEQEYNDWKDNLDDTISVIGDMDIVYEKSNDVLKEEIDLKKKGIELTTNVLKKTFPFIKNIVLRDDINDFVLEVNVVFDLSKFLKFSKTKLPKVQHYMLPTSFEEYLNSLKQENSYLFLFIDYNEGLRLDYGWRYNEKIMSIFNRYYSTLPKYMQYTQFRNMNDHEIEQYAIERDIDPEYVRKWKEDKEPVEFTLKSFIPIVNEKEVKKHYDEYESNNTIKEWEEKPGFWSSIKRGVNNDDIKNYLFRRVPLDVFKTIVNDNLKFGIKEYDGHYTLYEFHNGVVSIIIEDLINYDYIGELVDAFDVPLKEKIYNDLHQFLYDTLFESSEKAYSEAVRQYEEEYGDKIK